MRYNTSWMIEPGTYGGDFTLGNRCLPCDNYNLKARNCSSKEGCKRISSKIEYLRRKSKETLGNAE